MENKFDLDSVWDISDEKTYSKSYLLKTGWSEEAIRELLPRPMLRDNPYYTKGYAMQVWYEDDVKQAEKTKKFKEYADKKIKRQQISKKAIETRRRTTKEIAQKLSLNVKRINYEDVKDMTKLHQLLLYKREELSINAEVDFVLMYLTNYQREIRKLKGCVGKKNAINQYSMSLREKIFEVYPEILDNNKEIAY
jgi:hypothetical protein